MENQIIIGIRVTDKIQEQLDRCIPAHEFYFKENNPDYLQIIHVNGERVLGKALKPGVSITSLEDYAANVRSIFCKICPEMRLAENDVKIFAQTLIG